jgi:hypothetical protein
MAVEHGSRSCYNRGCRRPECVAAERAYNQKRRTVKKTGSTSTKRLSTVNSGADAVVSPLHAVPSPEREPGPTESAVLAEIEGLSTADSRPGVVALALAHARVLDDPVAVSQHASNGRQLRETLDALRKGADARGGRLASVRQIGRTG